MLSTDLVRSTVDLVILSTLAEEPNYGYAIAKRIDDISAGEYAIKETTLYAAIRRLEQRGDLESFAGTESAGRPRTYYRLTAQGSAHLATRVVDWQTAERVVSRFLNVKASTS